MNEEKCCTYDEMTRKFIECQNLHPSKTKIEGHAGTCDQCKYTVLLADEYMVIK